MESRTPSELWSVTLDVADLRDVPPRDVVDAHVERGRQSSPLLRTWRVAPLRDRVDDPLLDAGRLDELRNRQRLFRHPVGKRFHWKA